MKQEIAFEEAYPLILNYVSFYYKSKKFYSINARYSLEDMQQEVVLHFLEKKYLQMYDPEITSKKYFIMTGVKHFFIKLATKKRITEVEGDATDEDGLDLWSRVEDKSSSIDNLVQRMEFEDLLNEFEDETNSKIIVKSPIGEGKATPRMLVLLLSEGYTQAQIRTFFINPKTGQPVTSGRIAQMVAEIRDILEMCGYGR